MKKPSSFNIHIDAGRISQMKTPDLGRVLSIALLLFLAVLGFIIYSGLYAKIFISEDVIVPAEIVRVDLKNYQTAIDLINSLESYAPPELTLPNPNPFR